MTEDLQRKLDAYMDIVKEKHELKLAVLFAIEKMVNEEYVRQVDALIPLAVRQADKKVSAMGAMGEMMIGKAKKIKMSAMDRKTRKEFIAIRIEWDRCYMDTMNRLCRKRGLRK
jgi:hypothetical protein